jgi:hypothetical protein
MDIGDSMTNKRLAPHAIQRVHDLDQFKAKINAAREGKNVGIPADEIAEAELYYNVMHTEHTELIKMEDEIFSKIGRHLTMEEIENWDLIPENERRAIG